MNFQLVKTLRFDEETEKDTSFSIQESILKSAKTVSFYITFYDYYF